MTASRETAAASQGIPPRLLPMVAEVLACADPDPATRRDHRRAKVMTFPENDRERVRDLVNSVIRQRARFKP